MHPRSPGQKPPESGQQADSERLSLVLAGFASTLALAVVANQMNLFGSYISDGGREGFDAVPAMSCAKHPVPARIEAIAAQILAAQRLGDDKEERAGTETADGEDTVDAHIREAAATYGLTVFEAASTLSTLEAIRKDEHVNVVAAKQVATQYIGRFGLTFEVMTSPVQENEDGTAAMKGMPASLDDLDHADRIQFVSALEEVVGTLRRLPREAVELSRFDTILLGKAGTEQGMHWDRTVAVAIDRIGVIDDTLLHEMGHGLMEHCVGSGFDAVFTDNNPGGFSYGSGTPLPTVSQGVDRLLLAVGSGGKKDEQAARKQIARAAFATPYAATSLADDTAETIVDLFDPEKLTSPNRLSVPFTGKKAVLLSALPEKVADFLLATAAGSSRD